MSQKHERSIFADVEEYESDEEFSAWRRNLRLWRSTLSEQWRLLTDDSLVVAAMAILGGFILLAFVAPVVAPHDPLERMYTESGLIAKWIEPSFLGGEGDFLLGTTAQGYDIFSQLVYGARPALLVGFVAAVMTVGIGTMVGLTAGYYGGYVDDFLMRLVDFVYGLPLLPTVIVLVTVLGAGLDSIILAFVLLQWRTSARVIRALVLSLRERAFVKAARVSGASNWRILSRHIAPNVLPMAFLYGAFAIAWAILTEAGVSFLGLGDPNSVSWGVMLQGARVYSAMTEGTWWWFVPPGVCIALVVISGFLIGRGYEEIVNPELQVEQ
ncbi:ABC transporter permease [Candidatus Halobonum tyrrellensis]|uniref:Dipeptide/oligopeptide/nickel ABC transporter permease n=1 Tax=Candidatus Halobonum tyrrellensis G22 TaxID=1324957 RepID=V4HCN9_9EURY|nr:ABC transporter permease [Candidatus Halobonum tyrrellensis]ESP88465.1 dipeptide/oligopeptide/nickel ABC transporter permease [Candidatus Halobonum tyrrellensis G22]